jgi:hypothetical protein
LIFFPFSLFFSGIQTAEHSSISAYHLQRIFANYLGR